MAQPVPRQRGQGSFPICSNEDWKEPRHMARRKPAVRISGEYRCCWGPTDRDLQLRFCLGAPKSERGVCSFVGCSCCGQVPISTRSQGRAHVLP